MFKQIVNMIYFVAFDFSLSFCFMKFMFHIMYLETSYNRRVHNNSTRISKTYLSSHESYDFINTGPSPGNNWKRLGSIKKMLVFVQKQLDMSSSRSWPVLAAWKWRFSRGIDNFHGWLLDQILCLKERKSFAFNRQDIFTYSKINLKLDLNLPLGKVSYFSQNVHEVIGSPATNNLL